MAFARYPDRRLAWATQKLPLLLWRLGLHRVAMSGGDVVLTTVGRRTGQPRHTPLSPRYVGSTAYLWCPYGDRAQWYLKARAHPVVTVQAPGSSRSYRASRVLEPEEVRQVYAVLAGEDFPMLDHYLDGEGLGHSVEDVVAAGRGLHALRLDPVDVPGPAPLGSDLSWVWAVGGTVATALAVVVRRPWGRKGMRAGADR